LTKKHLATRVIHGGQQLDPSTGAVMPPIYTSSTYAHSSPGEHQGFEYSRAQNPTRFAYERSVANLESASHAFAFASGLAAVHAIIDLLQPGDHLIAADDLYGGTVRLLQHLQTQKNIHCSFVDCSDIDKIKAAINPQTKLIWCETPSNPLLKLVDLSAIAKLAKAHHILTACDNTFATPILQRPIELGFDVVMHSATKYLGGHSDVINGVVAVNDEALAEKIYFTQYAQGAVASAFDSYLVLRGIKTLAVRMQAHCQNALTLAHWLETHSRIKRVIYPGLASHPQHALAKQQMSQFGGMITVELDADLAQTKTFLQRCQLFTLAESLGGVESLIEHPALMTHSSLSEAQRQALGINDSLVRLSVGIEACTDLQHDLGQALDF